MLFEETPKFKSKLGRKMFRETAEKKMTFAQEAKVKRYLEKKLGGKKDISTREYKLAEQKAMKRFSVGRGAYAEGTPPPTLKEAAMPKDMLRDKIAREKMPTSLHDAAYQAPQKQQVKQINLRKEPIPEKLSDIISHKSPSKKPPKDS